MNAAQPLLRSSRLAEAPGAVPRLRLAGLEKPNFNPFGYVKVIWPKRYMRKKLLNT